ncbi:hypothetical protein M5X00_30015 [Paenibacillus alvei]|uniref:Copper amine oxidase-like N-terminal domain-containing protein n=1 Tax=Paenibacillus alvei TaxID=44250 RepID=A0ABT4H1I7_PAEAL|nr:hypothetical protein [Paenibacillus alvei]EJW14459.1 hypothetical protein PAV_13c00780 [Paenibacillus alvei DSM 29]MCY9543718.1 hypothetical protein [Paenibacillus alvei]MCY9708219.1 hypothetical protein [Paenibacillus alvei]MCY9737927.1 hypothetical protein [Paenibacillus alvei]MCY9758459.1 hypothetical protein [Paenibacillus alvei]
MKKFITGVIVGALIMVSPQVYGAASSIIGKKVDGELVVKIDGKQAGKAAVVDGKSYLPVRDVVNELGLKIKVENKEVIITSTSEDKIAEEVKKQVDAMKKEEEIEKLKQDKQKVSKKLEEDKSNIEISIANMQKAKEKYDDTVSRTNDPFHVDPLKTFYESSKTGHENLLKRIEDNEKELERINNRLKELGAE